MLLVSLLLLLFFSACSGKAVKDEVPAGSFVISGTMRFINIETGCWVLESTDGKKYAPAGEDLDPLWKDNLLVDLRVRPLPGVSTTCQVGEPVLVLTILKTLEP